MDRAPAKQGRDSRVCGTAARDSGGPGWIPLVHRQCYLFRRQSLDQPVYARPVLRMAPPWGKFAEGQQDKGPRRQIRVRKHRNGARFADQSIVVQQVEIQCSRRVGLSPNPAELGFDCMKNIQEGRRRQGRGDFGNAIDKPRLIRWRHGRASIPARPARHPNSPVFQGTQSSLAVAYGTAMLGMREV